MMEDYTGGIYTKFGENAGKLWIALNGKNPLCTKDIVDITHLTDSDFYTAVGWLARENKIAKDDRGCYKLDNTNLTSKIGTTAGRVWKIMDIWGDVEFSTITRLADVDPEDVYTALGWLARENKIRINEKQKYDLK
jgi:hypothetical protein